MAMSRDQLLPKGFASVSRFGTPLVSILLTVGVIVFIILALDPLRIAKLASAFQLMMFALLCLAVVVMRKSGLDSYDPSFRVPLFPWLPLFGIGAPFFLIYEMGPLPTLFSMGLVAAGVCWYMGYASKHVTRRGAIFHVFARLGEQRHDDLDVELRTILKEKGLRAADPFDEVVIGAIVLDLESALDFDTLVAHAAGALSMRMHHPAQEFIDGFTEGTLKGATPVAKGVALPHMHLPDIEHAQLVLARCKEELEFVTGDVFGKTSTAEHIHAVCFLVSNENDPGQHLRMLAQIATRIDQDDFLTERLAAENEVRLREVFLRDERHISVRLEPGSAAEELIGKMIRDLGLPVNCLVAAIRRDGRTLVPRGGTCLEKTIGCS
jgi:mannitol/fructose-specific phosphotransferase system IIA component (Ntr-type)